MHQSRTRSSFPNLEVGGAIIGSGRSVTPNAAAGVALTPLSLVPRRAQLRLENVAVAVDADDDFGSVKLLDLPDGNLVVIGALVDLTFVGADGIDTPANVDVAIGTVATASSGFTNSGEDDIVPKLDGTAGGVVQGGPTATEALGFLAASSDSVYLNVGVSIGSDGSATFNGTVELIYLDLGDPAA